jgi:8-amino-7-oxononanoate synthase
MGTLGKAYGSYGAYILGSSEIISFLVNRAKPIVYSTAPSLFDTALGFEALKYIIKNSEKIKNNIVKKQNIIKKELDLDVQSLIVPIKIGNNANVLQIQEKLKKNGLLVGAIRQPTVKSAIIRLIVRVNISNKKIKKACKILKEFL